MQAKWKRETTQKQKIHFNISARESGVIDMTVVFSILSIIQYFNRGVLHLLHRIPSKLDVSAHKPKHEAISLMDHKPRKIVNNLWLISSETNLAYYTENFVFSALHKDRPDNQDDGNF